MKRIFLLLIFQINILFSFSFLCAQDIFCDGFSDNSRPITSDCIYCEGIIEGYTANPRFFITVLKDPSCFELNNYRLFSLLSNSEGKIKLNISAKGCFNNGGITAGIEGLIYDPLMNEISDCFNISPNDSTFIDFKNLIPNEFYTLLLDGINSAVCYAELNILTNYSAGNLPIGNIGIIRSSTSNLNNLCQGDEFCISVDSASNATSYYWQYPDFLTPIIKKKSTLCLKVNNLQTINQSGNINVTPLNGCKSGITSSNILVSRNPIEDRTILIDTAICVDGIIQFGDQTYDSPGIYDFILPRSQPSECDSEAKLTLSISGDLSTQIQCINDTFLNVLSINWDDIRLADGYFVLINGDTVSDQSHRGFFYTPNPNGEQVDLKIQPYNSRGCSFEAGFASCFAEPTTSVFEENLNEEIRVFPNPSSDFFQIESDVLIEKTTVLNIFGEKIFETNSNKIELDQFPSGIYFFVIKTLRKTAVRKVLKN